MNSQSHRQYASRNIVRRCELAERRSSLKSQIDRLQEQLFVLDELLYENRELQKAMCEGFHIAAEEELAAVPPHTVNHAIALCKQAIANQSPSNA